MHSLPVQEQEDVAVIQRDAEGEIQDNTQQEKLALSPVEQDQGEKGIGQAARAAPVPGQSHCQQGHQSQEEDAQERTGPKISARSMESREVSQSCQWDAMIGKGLPQPPGGDGLMTCQCRHHGGPVIEFGQVG